MAVKKAEEIVVKPIKVEHATITIVGKGDLVLNKMNASHTRQLIADDSKAAGVWEAQHKNKWEDIITSIHWRDGIPVENTNDECSEELFYDMLTNTAPCISYAIWKIKARFGQCNIVVSPSDAFVSSIDSTSRSTHRSSSYYNKV